MYFMLSFNSLSPSPIRLLFLLSLIVLLFISISYNGLNTDYETSLVFFIISLRSLYLGTRSPASIIHLQVPHVVGTSL